MPTMTQQQTVARLKIMKSNTKRVSDECGVGCEGGFCGVEIVERYEIEPWNEKWLRIAFHEEAGRFEVESSAANKVGVSDEREPVLGD